MTIEFEDDKLKEWLIEECPYYKTLSRKLDRNMLKTLIKRKDQILAAETFQKYLDFGLGKPHALTGNFKGYYGVNLTGNFRLILKPKVDELSSQALKECKTVILRGVDDYHGGKSNWLIP